MTPEIVAFMKEIAGSGNVFGAEITHYFAEQ